MTVGTFTAFPVIRGTAVFTHIKKLFYIIFIVHRVLPLPGFIGIIFNELISHFAPGARHSTVIVDCSAISAKFHLGWYYECLIYKAVFRYWARPTSGLIINI